jgi:hypothetical protein
LALLIARAKLEAATTVKAASPPYVTAAWARQAAMLPMAAPVPAPSTDFAVVPQDLPSRGWALQDGLNAGARLKGPKGLLFRQRSSLA